MLKSTRNLLPALLLPLLGHPVFSQGFLQDYTLQVHTGYSAASSTNIDGTDIGIDVGEGYSIGLGIGRSVNENIRVELDWTYHHLNVDEVVGSFLRYPTPYRGLKDITSNFESDLSYSSILLNVYYDKEVHERFSVFGGVGAGFSIVESSFHGTVLPSLRPYVDPGLAQYYDSLTGFLSLPGDKQSVGFAWQFALGAIFEVNKNMDIWLAWKYFNPGSAGDLGDLDINTLEVAFRYNF
jgi:opacity protein-like surface antigen